jgi:hypothetical protein
VYVLLNDEYQDKAILKLRNEVLFRPDHQVESFDIDLNTDFGENSKVRFLPKQFRVEGIGPRFKDIVFDRNFVEIPMKSWGEHNFLTWDEFVDELVGGGLVAKRQFEKVVGEDADVGGSESVRERMQEKVIDGKFDG